LGDGGQEGVSLRADVPESASRAKA
jgi:hypothetical protein